MPAVGAYGEGPYGACHIPRRAANVTLAFHSNRTRDSAVVYTAFHQFFMKQKYVSIINLKVPRPRRDSS